jgi:hypothetical protein
MAKKAFLVGIDDYPGSRNDLDSSGKDVEFWVDVFKRNAGVPGENIRILSGQGATRKNFDDQFSWFSDGLGAEDEAFFFFSGHGGHAQAGADKAECLMLWDGCVTAPELDALGASIDARFKLFVLDCCFSGGFGLVFPPRKPKTATAAPVDGSPAAIRFGNTGHGYTAFAACQPGQIACSATSQTWGLSAFSYSIKYLRSDAKSLAAPLQAMCDYSHLILRSLGFLQNPCLGGEPSDLNRIYFPEA